MSLPTNRDLFHMRQTQGPLIYSSMNTEDLLCAMPDFTLHMNLTYISHWMFIRKCFLTYTHVTINIKNGLK